jgi:hypothetical protein
VAEFSSFHSSLQWYLNDTKSLLELYKASKVSIFENELILDNIGYWSGSLLMDLPLDGVQRLPILRDVITINMKISFHLMFTLCIYNYIYIYILIPDRVCS